MKIGVKFKKTLKEAVVPKRAHQDDTGWDLSIVKFVGFNEKNLPIYDTGIAVETPEGYYFEVVGRSSITKSGWMLANNIGVIDQSYRDSIKVVLCPVVFQQQSEMDVESNSYYIDEIPHKPIPYPELPKRICQLVLRERIDCHFVETEELSTTERNLGGFGSTDEK